MQTTTHGDPRATTATTVQPPATTVFGGTLDDLLALDARALEQLYRGARVPRLEDVRGDLRGRMLAVVDLPSVLRGPVRAFAGSDAFPWRGKSFQPRDAHAGEGVNRVFSDRLRLFTFGTFVGPSRAGAFEAVQLDYDRPSNPFFIRAIKDEIRELRPGLWLGQAWLHAGGTDRLVLYFGLTSDR